MLVLKKDKKNERSYKFGRWLLIGLALASIPLDAQKAYEEVEKSRIYLNKSMLDTVSFYSATISIHFIGLASAFEHEIWLTVACRLLSAFIYQCELNSRTNETLPSDPEEMQKVLKDKYPHKYPPGYPKGKPTKRAGASSSRSGGRPVKPTNSKFGPTRRSPTNAAKRPAKKSTKRP